MAMVLLNGDTGLIAYKCPTCKGFLFPQYAIEKPCTRRGNASLPVVVKK